MRKEPPIRPALRFARRPALPLAALALALAVPSAAVWGQGQEYIAPGELAVTPVNPREALEAAVENARWSLGPVRIDPWIGLREAAWVKNGDEPADFTATAGAGLRAYLPVGTRAVVAAHVLPEYVWWRDHADARRWAGREGVGLFVYGGRTAVSLTATSSDLTGIASSELDQRADQRDRRYEGSAEIPLTSRFGVLLRAGRSTFSAKDPGLGSGLDFTTLDRTDSWQDVGLRWWPSAHVAVGAGAGWSKTDFDSASPDRSNDGTSWFADLSWQRAHTRASVAYRREKRDPTSGSLFVPFDDDTGSATLAWTPRQRLGLSLYGLRSLSYSIFAADSYFLDQRLGAELSLAVGRRATLAGFYEDGTHDYVGATPDEDVTSVGGRLSVVLYRDLRLLVNGRRTRTRSPFADRTDSQVGFQVVYSGGSGGGTWY